MQMGLGCRFLHCPQNSDFRLSGMAISYRRTGDGKCSGILTSAHLPTQTKPPEQVLPVPDAWYSVLLLPYRQTDAPVQTALQNSTVLRPALRFAAAPLEPYAVPHQISAAHAPSSQLPGSVAGAYDSPIPVCMQPATESFQKLLRILCFAVWLVVIQHNRMFCISAGAVQPHPPEGPLLPLRGNSPCV